MKKQILILRLISALFVVFAITRLSLFFWVKMSLTQILHVLLISIVSLAVAAGLLKRWQWARWLAMALMTIGLASSMVGAYETYEIIQLAAAHNPDVPIFMFWLIGAPMWAAIVSSIWWLAKSSTKSFFNDKLKTAPS